MDESKDGENRKLRVVHTQSNEVVLTSTIVVVELVLGVILQDLVVGSLLLVFVQMTQMRTTYVVGVVLIIIPV